MNVHRLFGVVVALCTVAAVSSARQPPDQVQGPLSAPARPGTLVVSLVDGSITVRGSNRRDVQVTARGQSPANQPAGRGGLRQLAAPAAFSIEEERNRVVIEPKNPNRAIDFEIDVPSRTNLKLDLVNTGEVVVEGVEGEIEVENVNGPITLNRVAGGMV